MTEKFEAIKSVLEELDEETIIGVWNAYSADDNRIYENNEYEINEVLNGKSPFDVILSIDNYNATYPYFVYGVYGIKTFENVEDYIFYDDLTRAIENDYKILTENVPEEDWVQDITNAIIEYGKKKGIDTDNWSAPFCNEDMLHKDWDELLEDE